MPLHHPGEGGTGELRGHPSFFCLAIPAGVNRRLIRKDAG
jgi:hypothetical protein